MIEARSWGWYPAPLPSRFIQNAVPILCTLLVVIKIALTTEFHRFLARFSGRRRRVSATQSKLLLPLNSWRILLVVLISLSNLSDACSSRSIPKPRIVTPTQPPSQVTTTTTNRPNITFPTFACNERYKQFYCLNGATCFIVRISGSILYNCECATGYWGQRCEYKNLQSTYNISEHFYLNASTASGVSIGIFMFIIISVFVYQIYQRKKKRKALIEKLTLTSISKDCVDGTINARSYRLNYREPIFGTRWKPIQQARHLRTEIQFPTKIRSALKSHTAAAIYPHKKYRRRFFGINNRNLQLIRQDHYQLPQVPPPSPHSLSVSDRDANNQHYNNNNNTFIYINNNNNNNTNPDVISNQNS